MGRIVPSDSIHEALQKMSEGNPDAISAMLDIYGQTLEIDPTVGLGQLHYILWLDDLGVYGGTIWVLYKDVCGQDAEKVLTLCRAWQLGLLKKTALIHIITSGQRYDTSKLLAEVQAVVPDFGAKPKTPAPVQEPEPPPANDLIAGAVLGGALIDEVATTVPAPAPVEEKPFEGFKGGSTGGGGAEGSWEPEARMANAADREITQEIAIPTSQEVAPIEAAAVDVVDTTVDAPDTSVDTSVEADAPDSPSAAIRRRKSDGRKDRHPRQ
jgi:hypothetical protein